MTISVTCQCGKGYRVSADKSGKRFKRRECGTLVRVPNANGDAIDDDVDLGDDDSEVAHVRATHSIASTKRTWSQMVIPIVNQQPECDAPEFSREARCPRCDSITLRKKDRHSIRRLPICVATSLGCLS